MPTVLGKFHRHLVWGAALIAIALTATACLTQERDLSLEQQAQEIDRSLMCPVCPSETVDQSQVELAKQMRAIIREKLAAGESRQQILDFFVARYGEDVLAAPPKSGFNLVAWLVPGALVMGGVAALFIALRAMRRGHGQETTPVRVRPVEEDLTPYLARVDEEMHKLLEDAPPPQLGGPGVT